MSSSVDMYLGVNLVELLLNLVKSPLLLDKFELKYFCLKEVKINQRRAEIKNCNFYRLNFKYSKDCLDQRIMIADYMGQIGWT